MNSLMILLLSLVFSAGNHEIAITVTNLKSDDGKLRIYVYSPSEEFLGEKVYKELVVPIEKPGTDLSLNLPSGEYAIFVAHDKNNDGEVNLNFLGIPKEGIGVSRNSFGGLTKPDFEECSVSLTQDIHIEIELVHY